jgi:hypothetical protein
MSFELGDYNDVPSRIAEFRTKYPDGSLQPADPTQPYKVEKIAEKTFIVYTAAAYRTPDDHRPGIGMAWEQFPGRTPYTRDSELQNAETSAWGRAIVAALAADTRKGIASAEEVRNRRAEREHDDAPTPASVRSVIARVGKDRGMQPDELAADFRDWSKGVRIGVTEDVTLLTEYLAHLRTEVTA